MSDKYALIGYKAAGMLSVGRSELEIMQKLKITYDELSEIAKIYNMKINPIEREP